MRGIQITLLTMTIVLISSCTAKKPLRKEIVKQASAVHKDDEDVILRAVAEIQEEEGVERIVVESPSLVQEVDSHLKKDTESSLYKTVYVRLDDPKKLRSGFYSFSRDCHMREAAHEASAVVGVVGKEKRLWVEDHSGPWARVYRKSGPAYIFKSCLSN